MNTLELKIQNAWDFILTKLLHPATNQIYDYRTSEDADGAFRHLPTPEEIAKSIPNPCGWLTGMEDSNISGGLFLDAIINRYAVTGDISMKKYADIIYNGLMLNASISEQDGFLARAVLPLDLKSHYINSSRDQYTHWIYSMVQFHNSNLSSDSQRTIIREKLVAIAKKAQRDVTAKNDYCLLREDGKPALVCDMLSDEVMPHESLRLPMFYAAAYFASGDKIWLDEYVSLRGPGLAKAEAAEFGLKKFWSCGILAQMQLSIHLLYELEEDKTYKERYRTLLERLANGCDDYFANTRHGMMDYPNYPTVISWRDCPPKHITSYVEKYGYTVEMRNVYMASVNDCMRRLINPAAAVIVEGLSPDHTISGEHLETFLDLVDIIDFNNCFAYFPVHFICAYWMLKRAGRL